MISYKNYFNADSPPIPSTNIAGKSTPCSKCSVRRSGKTIPNISKFSTIPRFFPFPKKVDKEPKKISDADYLALYQAFGTQTDYPKYLKTRHRPDFWRTIMHFVTVTALRREAVLGLSWTNINQEELFLTVPAEIDKKDKRRIKPITKNLLADLLHLQSLGEMKGVLANRVFPWPHGNKTWYKCWNSAEETAKVTLGLHDLKRYSGDLALRAGATMLELQKHMDHASVQTTLNHYCRPETRDLVNRMDIPSPDRKPDPLADLEEHSEKNAQFLDERRLAKLLAAEIDIQRLAAAIRGDSIRETSYSEGYWVTNGGTKLRVFDGKEVG